MNLKKLKTKELENLINTTTDLKLLSLAEEEYINRATQGDLEETTADYSDIEELRRLSRIFDIGDYN